MYGRAIYFAANLGVWVGDPICCESRAMLAADIIGAGDWVGGIYYYSLREVGRTYLG